MVLAEEVEPVHIGCHIPVHMGPFVVKLLRHFEIGGRVSRVPGEVFGQCAVGELLN